MRKENSTNSLNETRLNLLCGMSHALSVIGGRWKPSILFSLTEGRKRYNELRKDIPGISERMLVAQLRELEGDGLVERTVFPEVPPRVEYALTDFGRSTEPMLREISAWGARHRKV